MNDYEEEHEPLETEQTWRGVRSLCSLPPVEESAEMSRPKCLNA